MDGARKGVAVALAGLICLGVGSASAGEPPAGPAEEPRFHQHTLRGMFCKFSWQAKKRPWYQHVLWYVPSRLADALDMVGIGVGGGYGIHANVHATRFLQLAIGRHYSTWAGLMSRYPVVVDQEVDERAIGWWWRVDLSRRTRLGQAPDLDIGEDEVLKTYHKAVDPAGVGAAVFYGIVGVSVEIKLHEVLDFLKGLVTIDSLEDDY